MTAAASFLAGFLASLGVGGGVILIVYLTYFAGYGQLEAQFANLIFFLPIALISIIIHKKSGLIEMKKLVPGVTAGTVFSALGAFTAHYLGSEFLGKIYSGFLVIFGIYTILKKQKK